VRKSYDLAERKTVQAYYLQGTMAIFAAGQVPSPQHAVTIERDTRKGSEDRFYLACRHASGIVTPNDTPYAVSKLFPTADPVSRICVDHAGGTDDIEVEQVHVGPAHPNQPPPYIFPPSAIRGAADATTATGYSCRFDFGEALHHAVKALPAADFDATTTPECVTVLEIGAEVGGIAGFDHLFVRVRRMGPLRRLDVADARLGHSPPAPNPGLEPARKG